MPGGSNPVDHYMFLMQRNVEDRDEYTWMFQHPYKKAILPEVSNSIEVLNNLGAKNTRKTKIFAPILKQLAALTWRANICAMRDPILTVIRLVQTLFNAIIVLSIWWQISDDPLKADSVHNRTGVLYFCAMFNFIPGMFMVLISFPMERHVFLKEYGGRFYGVVAYFTAKFFAELPLCVFFPGLLQVLIYYGVGLNSEFIRFLQNILICMMVGLAGNSFGLLVGVIFTDFKVSSIIAPVVFYPMMLFSGFYVSGDSLPVWVTWLEYVSVFRYAMEFLVRVEFEGSAYLPSPVDIFGYNWGKWECFWALIGYIFILRG